MENLTDANNPATTTNKTDGGGGGGSSSSEQIPAAAEGKNSDTATSSNIPLEPLLPEDQSVDLLTTTDPVVAANNSTADESQGTTSKTNNNKNNSNEQQPAAPSSSSPSSLLPSPDDPKKKTTTIESAPVLSDIEQLKNELSTTAGGGDEEMMLISETIHSPQGNNNDVSSEPAASTKNNTPTQDLMSMNTTLQQQDDDAAATSIASAAVVDTLLLGVVVTGHSPPSGDDVPHQKEQSDDAMADAALVTNDAPSSSISHASLENVPRTTHHAGMGEPSKKIQFADQEPVTQTKEPDTSMIQTVSGVEGVSLGPPLPSTTTTTTAKIQPEITDTVQSKQQNGPTTPPTPQEATATESTVDAQPQNVSEAKTAGNPEEPKNAPQIVTQSMKEKNTPQSGSSSGAISNHQKSASSDDMQQPPKGQASGSMVHLDVPNPLADSMAHSLVVRKSTKGQAPTTFAKSSVAVPSPPVATAIATQEDQSKSVAGNNEVSADSHGPAMTSGRHSDNLSTSKSGPKQSHPVPSNPGSPLVRPASAGTHVPSKSGSSKKASGVALSSKERARQYVIMSPRTKASAASAQNITAEQGVQLNRQLLQEHQQGQRLQNQERETAKSAHAVARSPYASNMVGPQGVFPEPRFPYAAAPSSATGTQGGNPASSARPYQPENRPQLPNTAQKRSLDHSGRSEGSSSSKRSRNEYGVVSASSHNPPLPQEARNAPRTGTQPVSVPQNTTGADDKKALTLVRLLMGQTGLSDATFPILLQAPDFREASATVLEVVRMLVENSVVRAKARNAALVNANANTIMQLDTRRLYSAYNTKVVQAYAKRQRSKAEDQKKEIFELQKQLSEKRRLIEIQHREIDWLRQHIEADPEVRRASFQEIVGDVDKGAVTVQRYKKEIAILKELEIHETTDLNAKEDEIHRLEAVPGSKMKRRLSSMNILANQRKKHQKQIETLRFEVAGLESKLASEVQDGRQSLGSYMRAAVQALKAKKGSR